MSRYDDYPRSPNPKQYFRSRRNNVIAGVCGGLAERCGWDATLVRVISVLLMIFALGPLMVIAYLVAWLITPRAPLGGYGLAPEEDEFWRGVSDRPRATFGNLKYTFMDLDQRLQNIERKVTSEDWRLRKEFRDLERGQ